MWKRIRSACLRGLRWFGRHSIDLFRDVCLVAGFLAISYGCWLIYEPAAFLVGGVMLIYTGLPPKGGGEA